MRLGLASAAFFLSGVAALIYQIVWQRLLVLPMGADVYSTTIIVGAFMGGLGCGSLAGGRAADRLTPVQCIALFAAAEIAVGLFGFASRAVFYDWLYLRLGPTSLGVGITAVAVFAGLLWPTFWMGVSLPALSRAVVVEGMRGAASRVGVLYGLNTLGAACGAFVTTWIVFPRIGLEGSLRGAAILNVLAALVALPLLAFDRAEPQAAGIADDTDSRAESSGWPFAAWIALYAFAGFQALSLEIVWFRLLGVMAKSSAFTFGTLLTIYLSGLGLGAAAGSALLRRVRRPGVAFLVLQGCVGLYAGVSVLALVAWLPTSPSLSALWSYFAGYEPFDAAAAFSAFWSGNGDGASTAHFLRLYVLLPGVLVGPPTIAMGACFPLLQKIALVDAGHLGRRVAAVYLSNIAGSAAGSIVTGWIALSWLGTAGSLRLLAMLGGVFLGLAVVAAFRLVRPLQRVALRPSAALLVVAAVAAIAIAMPDGRRLWAAVHGSAPSRLVTAEDATGLALVKHEGGRAVVYVNGIGQSWIPYGNIHTVLGALPAFVHPDPRTAAVIGLGSGDTVYALSGRQELARAVCIEIVRPQLATLQAWARRTEYPPLGTLLSDARIEHVAGDGRAHIMRSRHRFDIIEADALRPGSAYSGHLYSVGYFSLLRSRLAHRGIAVTWAPTPRIHDTFTSVFPHVLSFGDIVLGSETPIHFAPHDVRARLRVPAVREHFQRAGVDLETLLAPYLDAAPRRIVSADTPRRHDLNEDLFPRDEFSLPRK
jgi:spermidine synthase